MRRRTYLILVVAMIGAIAVPAADTSLLPDHFGAWQAEAPSKIVSGQNLYTGFGTDVRTDILRESGLARIEQRTYRSGERDLKFDLEVFKDPTGAYQSFTQSNSPGDRKIALGDESAFNANGGRILIGNFVVVVSTTFNVAPQELIGLAAALQSKADHTPYPPLRIYVPVEDQIYGTQKYALGPIGLHYALEQLNKGSFEDLEKEVGFSSGVEAMMAKYQSGREGAVLLLLEYPTPQLAEQHLHHLEEALPPAAKKAGVNVERKASMLSLVAEASSPEYAQKLRDAVDYETQVTWNESSHTATDPPIVVVLVKIIVFTMMFMGVATGLGILYGGMRILIKRRFPGKIFDRPQDIEVLQMGLSGKKIDPSDMY
jgi:hypothetical protein